MQDHKSTNVSAFSERDALNNNSENQTPPTPSGINNPQTVRILQVVVVVMGLILVIGFLTVLGRILYLYFGTNDASLLAPGQHISGGTTTQLALPQGARVTTMSLSGDRLAIYFETTKGNGIKILNTKTGAIENTIKFVPGIPEN